MKTITWDMVEQFTFPVGLGAIEDVVSVQVNPQWEQSEDGQSIRLSGIYHVMASVQFNPVQQVEQVDGTYIEHIDIEQSTGYFEYALPLDVDLPKDKVVGPITLVVNDIKASSDAASCQFMWQVQCDFTNPLAETKETVVHQEIVQQEPVKQQVVQKKIEERKQEQKQEQAQAQAQQERVDQQVAQHKIEEQEQAQHEIIQQEAMQRESGAIQESSFNPVIIEKSPLYDDFFADLSDTYSLFDPNLNKIRS